MFWRSKYLDSRDEEIRSAGRYETVEQLIPSLINCGEPWVTEFSIKNKRLIAVNQEMATCETAIKEGDEVAFSHCHRRLKTTSN